MTQGNKYISLYDSLKQASEPIAGEMLRKKENVEKLCSELGCDTPEEKQEVNRIFEKHKNNVDGLLLGLQDFFQNRPKSVKKLHELEGKICRISVLKRAGEFQVYDRQKIKIKLFNLFNSILK